MELKKLINKRFSVRKYKNVAIENEKLIEVLDAGRLAPSAANFQPWYFIVVQNPQNLKKLHSVYKREWIRSAPAIIIVCGDHLHSWKRGNDGKDSSDIDVAIAVDHMTLQAAELGLGTCWVCNFDAKECSELFDLPPHIEPVVLLPLGYPDEEVKEKKRKPLEEIVFWEKYPPGFRSLK
jgi:nitroreductase